MATSDNATRRKRRGQAVAGEPWYAPHPALRTPAAEHEARELAKRLFREEVLEPVPKQDVLFLALHTCAYWASGTSRTRQLSTTTRRRWSKRWRRIRDYIVEQNLGLVYSSVSRFNATHADDDDLLSDALLALTRAVDRFDPWRGFKFSTYACNCIVRACMRRGKREYQLRQRFPVQHDSALEKPVEEADANEAFRIERLQTVLDTNAGELTDLESKVLERRFPRDGDKRLTFQEIGRAVGLSKERVRQIQNVALDKLREALSADPLLD